MAEQIDLKVKLTPVIENLKGDISALQGTDAFKSKGGAKQLSRIQSLMQSIESVDLSKLKGPELTAFLNNILKLQKHLQSAASNLTNYSEEYKKALETVQKATEKASKAQDRLNEAQQKKAEKLKNVNLGYEGTTYKSAKTGREVKSLNTIQSLLQEGNLQVFGTNKEKPLAGAALDRRLENTGLIEYNAAEKEVQEFSKAVDNAKEALEKAQATLSKIDPGQEVHPVGKQIAEHGAAAGSTIGGIKDELNQTIDETNRQKEATVELTNVTNKQSTSFGRAFKQISLYAIALRTAKKAIREAVSTITELDKSLTTQAMVTGKTRKETYQLLKTYQDMASQLGATTKEVAEVATQFIRQGKTITEAKELTEAAISAAKVAGISGSESVNYLTTALNGFQMAASEAMQVSDKFAAIASQSATSYEELAVSLSKVAAQANLAGMSIDYTTALLAKGIETTREAPESIGTALKTVIARMRELTDYGETLEDGIDLNNVETQLAYVDIQLRDTNGELRSTEDVLNELGMQWQTLSSNQQAAIAKALAGTRQQSRLIAMMNDYDRVIELQQIAQRSTGATAAQAEVYLEGMEAAINKLNVAWEKLTTSVVNSDAIIWLVNVGSNFLEGVANFISWTPGLIVTFTTLASLAYVTLSNKMIEVKLAREQQKYALEQQKIELEKNKIWAEEYKASQKLTVQELKQKVAEQDKLIISKKQTIEKLKQQKADGKATDVEIEKAQLELQELERERDQYEQEVQNAQQADYILKTYQGQNTLLQQQSGLLGKITSGFTAALVPIMSMVSLYKLLAKGITTAIILTNKKKRADIEATGVAKVKAAWEMAGSAANIPVAGWIIAAGILALVLGRALVGLLALGSKAESTSQKVNGLSNSIYNLENQAQKIDTITDSYDRLDKQIIKTKEDQEELNKLLDEAGETLSSEEGYGGKKGKNAESNYTNALNNANLTSEQRAILSGWNPSEQTEQDYYKSLDEKGKREYLEAKKAFNNAQADQLRQDQINLIQDASRNSKERLEQVVQANASAIRATIKNGMYDSIDALGLSLQEQQAAYNLSEQLIDNIEMNGETFKAFFDKEGNLNTDKIQSLTNAIRNAGDAAKQLSDSSTNLKTAAEAYQKLLSSATDPDMRAAIQEMYSGLDGLTKMSSEVLNFADKWNITAKEFIDFQNSWESALESMNQEYAAKLPGTEELMASFARFGGDLTKVMSYYGIQAGEEGVQALSNAWAALTSANFSTAAQNTQGLKSTVGAFFKNAAQWSSMSDSDKASFINEYSQFFTGDTDLVSAVESGDYRAVSAALMSNETWKEKIVNQIVANNAAIEQARAEGNEAAVRFLQQENALLQDQNRLIEQNLKDYLESMIEVQNNQLDEYKTLLQKEQDALVDSLEKRKEAYEKYFEEVNQAEEDEQYEEEIQTMINNLATLSTSNQADARNKMMDLENQLQEREKERIQELRERAQDAILESMDDELEQINKKFDELLDNNRLLLAQMTGALSNPTEYFSRLLAQSIQSGQDDLAIRQMITEWGTRYGNVLPGFDFSSISTAWDEDISVQAGENNTFVITINGEEYQASEEQGLLTALVDAFKRRGKSQVG